MARFRIFAGNRKIRYHPNVTELQSRAAVAFQFSNSSAGIPPSPTFCGHRPLYERRANPCLQ
jgi:hypothetical protein